MYIQRNVKKGKNGKIYRSVLLCRKYRKDGIPKTETILNISHYSDDEIDQLSLVLNNHKKKVKSLTTSDLRLHNAVDIGYFFVLKHTLEKLKITKLFDLLMPTESGLIKLMIIGKVITQGSKLAIFNWVNRNPIYAELLDVDIKKIKLNDFYSALSTVSSIQNKINHKWVVYQNARQNEVFLYDITSSYLEGTQNALASFGYNRDGKKGKMQIVIGLITDNNGFPLKIEIFQGNIKDDKTVQSQLKQIKETFHAEKIIFVGDRGMKIRHNLEKLNELERSQIDYITGLTKPEIKTLLKNDILSLDLFSEEIISEVKDGDLRYVLSKNPILATDSKKTREALMSRFDTIVEEVEKSYNDRKTLYKANIQRINNGHKNKKLVVEFTDKKIKEYNKKICNAANKYHVNKFYQVSITKDKFEITIKQDILDNEIALDGIYVLITTVENKRMNKDEVRAEYKKLQHVEHAFRDLKTSKIQIRPIYHINKDTTEGHIILSMFSYALIFEMEKNLHPFLKSHNAKNKCQLNFKDLEMELNNIKLLELSLKNKIFGRKITELNSLQKNIFNLMEIKEKSLNNLATV